MRDKSYVLKRMTTYPANSLQNWLDLQTLKFDIRMQACCWFVQVLRSKRSGVNSFVLTFRQNVYWCLSTHKGLRLYPTFIYFLVLDTYIQRYNVLKSCHLVHFSMIRRWFSSVISSGSSLMVFSVVLALLRVVHFLNGHEPAKWPGFHQLKQFLVVTGLLSRWGLRCCCLWTTPTIPSLCWPR